MNKVVDTYNQIASTYDLQWFDYIKESNQLVLDALHEADYSFKKILDIGCGTGWLLAELGSRYSHAQLHGIDISQSMLDIARNRVGDSANLICGSAEKLPFADGEFDVVVSNSSLHFWPDITQSLREIRRISSPEAFVVVVDWHRDSLSMKLRSVVHRFTDSAYKPFFTTQELASIISSSGWEIVRQDIHTVSNLWGLQCLILKKL